MAVQYSDELERVMRDARNIMQDHARSIGELCMSWAALDYAIDRLFDPLLGCDKAVTASLTSSMEKMEARIAAIRRILVQEGISKAWSNWIDGLFRRILDEIAPIRNRYVHDRWQMKRGELQKIDKRASSKKLQAFQSNQLIFDTTKAIPTKDVDRLREYIDTVLWAIEIAAMDLEEWRTTKQMRPPREQWIPACKPRTRMDRFPIVIAWNGEQRLPFEYVTDPE